MSNDLKNNHESLNINAIKRLIHEFYALGGKSITLTGGEILLHKDLESIIEEIKSLQLQYALYSNLIILSKKHIEFLEKHKPYVIQVSLYSIRPEIHDSITLVKGSCLRTLNAIEQLKKVGIPIKIACPVMKENAESFIELLEFVQKHNLEFEPSFFISACENQSTENLDHRLTISEFENFLDNLLKEQPDFTRKFLSRDIPKYTPEYDFVNFLNTPLCAAGNVGLYVTASGKITICPQLQKKSYREYRI